MKKIIHKRKFFFRLGWFLVILSVFLFSFGVFLQYQYDNNPLKPSPQSKNKTAKEISFDVEDEIQNIEEETIPEPSVEESVSSDGIQPLPTYIDNNNNNSSSSYDISSSSLSIKKAGSYSLSGDYSCIDISTTGNVSLYLNGATIHCSNGPGIYVERASSVRFYLSNSNSINANTNDSYNGAIYSNDDLVFSGDGSLSIHSNIDGIVSLDTIVIRGGDYSIETDDDGIRGDTVAITNGSFFIHSSGDGIKASNTNNGYIAIDGGRYIIESVRDGIEAEASIKIIGGNFNIHTYGNKSQGSAKGIKAETILEIHSGTFQLDTNDDGFHSNGNIIIYNAYATLNCRDDAIHADGYLEINNGDYSIQCREGLEATYIKINGGNFTIHSRDDGINAVARTDQYPCLVEINNGSITIVMVIGDIDGIDTNGDLIINGGTIDITAEFPFDYEEGEAYYNGGTIIVNGKLMNCVWNQFEKPPSYCSG